MQKMWRNYTLAWVFYAFLLGVMMQSDALMQGQFSVLVLFKLMCDMLPAGVF